MLAVPSGTGFLPSASQNQGRGELINWLSKPRHFTGAGCSSIHSNAFCLDTLGWVQNNREVGKDRFYPPTPQAVALSGEEAVEEQHSLST